MLETDGLFKIIQVYERFQQCEKSHKKMTGRESRRSDPDPNATYIIEKDLRP